MSDTIISFLKDYEPVNEVQTLLRNIVLLQAKFEMNAEDDLLFQTSKEMQSKLLDMSMKKYALLVEVVNGSSLEQLNSHVEKVHSEIKKFASEHEMNSITGQKANTLNSQLEATKSFKNAKEQYGTLKPLDEILKDEATLLEIFS